MWFLINVVTHLRRVKYNIHIYIYIWISWYWFLKKNKQDYPCIWYHLIYLRLPCSNRFQILDVSFQFCATPRGNESEVTDPGNGQQNPKMPCPVTHVTFCEMLMHNYEDSIENKAPQKPKQPMAMVTWTFLHLCFIGKCTTSDILRPPTNTSAHFRMDTYYLNYPLALFFSIYLYFMPLVLG